LIPNLIIGQDKIEIIEEINNYDSISIFNNIQILNKFNTNELKIRLLSLDNLPGSAGFNSGKITENLFISISEFDEIPNQKLFVIKNLYGLKIEKIDKLNKNPFVIISHIVNGQKENLNIEISMEKIIIN
jgi:hypothetical protein